MFHPISYKVLAIVDTTAFSLDEEKNGHNNRLTKTFVVRDPAASGSRRSRAYAVESDMIEGLQRVFYYATRIAHRVLEASNRDDA